MSFATGELLPFALLEVRLPWSTLQVTPVAGLELGLLLANNDLDGDRFVQFAWHGSKVWIRPDRWGASFRNSLLKFRRPRGPVV